MYGGHKKRLSNVLRMDSSHQLDYLRESRGQGDKLATLLSYVLMPNHFHLLLRQDTDGGISKMMADLGNSYSRYFNTIHSRVGPIFQGRFQAVSIDTDEQLVHVSRYIHLNPYVAGIVSLKDLPAYKYSSYSQYASNMPSSSLMVDSGEVLAAFRNGENYVQFVRDQTDYGVSLKLLEKKLLDVE